MANFKYAPIGILGGMGPAATADLYLRIVRFFKREYGAFRDSDFPRIVIESVPIPDVVGSLEDERLTCDMLCEAARRLEAAGCRVIAIACNSVQFLLRELRASISVHVAGIAEAALRECLRRGITSIGLLATKTTIERGIYRPLLENGITLLYPSPSDQGVVHKLIVDELAGLTDEHARRQLLGIAKALRTCGAQAVALACTELPLIAGENANEQPILNCSEVYACEVARYASRESAPLGPPASERNVNGHAPGRLNR
jgi:aspartate racemase